MVVKPEQERVRTLLSDTITLLCRNGLTYKSKFNISALIGITLDEDEVFLVDIRETVKNAGEEDAHTDSSDNESSVPKSPTRKRKKKRRTSHQSSVDSDNENGAKSFRSEADQNSVASPFPHPAGTDNIKTEQLQDEDDDSQDLVFIKDEPGVTMADMSQTYSNTSQTSSLYSSQQHPPGDILGNLSQSGQLYATPASSEHLSGPSTSWGDTSLQQFSAASAGLPPGSSLSQSAAAAAMQGTSSQAARPHVCPECGRGFTLSQNLLAHRRKQHAGVYLHRCPECNKGYDNRNHLHGHLVSKHQRREYMAHCPHCGKAFARRDNMRAHVKAAHGGGNGGGGRWLTVDAEHRLTRLPNHLEQQQPQHSESGGGAEDLSVSAGRSDIQ